MIAKVSIDPRALEACPEGIPERDLLHHQHSLAALAERLVQHGCLLTANADEFRELLAAFQALERVDTTLGVRWGAALTRLRQTDRIFTASPERRPVATAAASGDLRREWSRAVRMAVLTDDHAAALGIRDTDARSRPEIASLLFARDSKTFRDLADLAGSDVWEEGWPRDDFWAKVLRPMARISKRIWICDRYMLRGMAEQTARRRRLRCDDALTWLLRKIDNHARRDVAVTLYVGLGERSRVGALEVPGPETCADAAVLIGEHFNPGSGRISKLDVCATEWNLIRKLDRPHDRHLAFSCGADIGLDAGLDGFDRAEVHAAAGIKWSYVVSDRGQEKNRRERSALEKNGELARVE